MHITFDPRAARRSQLDAATVHAAIIACRIDADKRYRADWKAIGYTVGTILAAAFVFGLI